jgi:hypothetical protein
MTAKRLPNIFGVAGQSTLNPNDLILVENSLLSYEKGRITYAELLAQIQSTNSSLVWKSSIPYSVFYANNIASITSIKPILVFLENDGSDVFTIDAGTYAKGNIMTLVDSAYGWSSVETAASGVTFTEGLPSMECMGGELGSFSFTSYQATPLYSCTTSNEGDMRIGKGCYLYADSSPLVFITNGPGTAMRIELYGKLFPGTISVDNNCYLNINQYDKGECADDAITGTSSAQLNLRSYSPATIFNSQSTFLGTITEQLLSLDKMSRYSNKYAIQFQPDNGNMEPVLDSAAWNEIKVFDDKYLNGVNQEWSLVIGSTGLDTFLDRRNGWIRMTTGSVVADYKEYDFDNVYTFDTEVLARLSTRFMFNTHTTSVQIGLKGSLVDDYIKITADPDVDNYVHMRIKANGDVETDTLVNTEPFRVMIDTIEGDGTYATAKTLAPHGLNDNDKVNILTDSHLAFNTEYVNVASVLSPTSFQYVCTEILTPAEADAGCIFKEMRVDIIVEGLLNYVLYVNGVSAVAGAAVFPTAMLQPFKRVETANASAGEVDIDRITIYQYENTIE